jgi:acyl-CoA synthetase (AMP-forming)/AMP-acid ligase II
VGQPVDVGSSPDPVAAVLGADAEGRRIALRTSGTTGRPRAVVRTTESWVRSFGHVADLTGLGEGSRLWVPGPLSATMNLFAAVLARHVGASLVVGAEQATHAHLTPLQLQRALDEDRPLAGLHLTVAGDRLGGQLRARAEAAGAMVSHYYGSAELSFVAWGSDDRSLAPFPGVEIEVRDGEIWVRSLYLCEEYDGPPGPLRRESDGFATVGDRGSFSDGVLVVSGRGDDAVVSGGATVVVTDVESALREGLRGSIVVVGVPHATLGQVVAAALTDADDVHAAHRLAEQTLSPAQRPRRWFHVPALPLTGSGKVDRSALVHRLGEPETVRLVPRRAPVGSS